MGLSRFASSRYGAVAAWALIGQSTSVPIFQPLRRSAALDVARFRTGADLVAYVGCRGEP
jgi:hypothetical protein